MVAGPRRLVRWRSDSSRIAATVCANRQPVDLWTTLRVAHKAHSRNNSSNSAEQNGKCVTHVAGLKCYLCRRLLTSEASEGEGVRKLQILSERPEPPHPNPLPSGERESRCGTHVCPASLCTAASGVPLQFGGELGIAQVGFD